MATKMRLNVAKERLLIFAIFAILFVHTITCLWITLGAVAFNSTEVLAAELERERRNKYKKQDDERDVERQKLRDKYNIAKPVNEDEESEDEDDAFGSVKKKEEDDDAVARKFENSLFRCIDYREKLN